MPDWALVFLFQTLFVLLLGMQSLNLNQGHVGLAGICSGLIGTVQFFIMATVAAAGVDAVGSLVWWGYVLSGPTGIMLAYPLQHVLKTHILRK